jgi:hypothetical protein
MKIVILALLLSCYGFANSNELVSFQLVLSYDGLKDTLTAGYSDSTTDNYDEAYEEDYPPFAPPSGIIIPTYRINRVHSNGGNELIYSRFDYRETPKNDTTIDYTLDILGTRDEGREFYVYVPPMSLPKTVESVRIIDKVLAGKIVDSNLVNGEKLYIDNRFLQNFIVRVKYNMNPTSVEDFDNEKSNIYYSNNRIYTNGTGANRLELYSIEGQRVLTDELNGDVYSLDGVNSGLYFVYIYDGDVVIRMLKIVKL